MQAVGRARGREGAAAQVAIADLAFLFGPAVHRILRRYCGAVVLAAVVAMIAFLLLIR